MKKIFLFMLSALLFGLLALPAHADSAISVKNQNLSFNFPKSMTFTLDASSTAEIQKATLVVRFPTVTHRVQAKINPGTSIHAIIEWNLDSENSALNGGYIPPGVSATYTWQLEDAAGNKLESNPQNFTVNDNRIEWQLVENDGLAIHWYGAGKSFGQTIFDGGIKTLQKVRDELGAGTGGKVHIWFYTNNDDFQTSMPNMNVWTGGRSFGEYRVIILSAQATNVQDAVQGAQHELTHQVIYDSLGNGLARQSFPQWLNEGLATYNQFDGGPLASYLNDPLQQAISSNTLPSLRSRDGNFPPDPHEALLSYGMSFALVDFLFKHFGNAKVNEMFGYFQQGMTADEAFMKAFATNTDGLDNLYRKSVGLPEKDYSNSGLPTAAAFPTFALSSAETPAPQGNATATPLAVSKANTPAPAATTAPQNTNTGNKAGGATGLCGLGLGGFALAMVGTYEWRKRRKPLRMD